MVDRQTNFATLMQQIHAGSEDAAFELLKTYGPSIITVVRRALRERLRALYDSRDFEQDVWASFFANPPDPRTVDRPEALMAFLITVARNKVLDAERQHLYSEKRGRKRQQSLDGSACWVVQAVAAQGPTPSAAAAARERWLGLPERDRRILELLSEGKRQDEVAAEVGLSVRTVQRVLYTFWGENGS